jgi:hypothetical protein
MFIYYIFPLECRTLLPGGNIMSKTNELRNSTRLINALCASCAAGLHVIDSHINREEHLPGNAIALLFCDQTCNDTWKQNYCSWCGATPSTTPLEVSSQIASNVRLQYCNMRHMRLYNEWFNAAVRH